MTYGLWHRKEEAWCCWAMPSQRSVYSGDPWVCNAVRGPREEMEKWQRIVNNPDIMVREIDGTGQQGKSASGAHSAAAAGGTGIQFEDK